MNSWARRAAREGERVPLVECAEDHGNNEKAICTRVDQIPRGNGVNNSPEAARVGVHQEVDQEDYVIVSQLGNHVNIQSVLQRVFFQYRFLDATAFSILAVIYDLHFPLRCSVPSVKLAASVTIPTKLSLCPSMIALRK